MNFYCVTIKPGSDFGTPIKGDTLFGHFCWQLAYDSTLVEGGIDNAIEKYSQQPFAIFSTAYPVIEIQGKIFYALKRPDIPLSRLFSGNDLSREEQIYKRKENKKKRWMLVDETLEVRLPHSQFLSDKELANAFKMSKKSGYPTQIQREKEGFTTDWVRPHNSINRLTWTTSAGKFAPYNQECQSFSLGARLAVFVLTDEHLTGINRICDGLSRIGAFGFGRDASTGLGRFTVENTMELHVNGWEEAHAAYTLGPCIPEDKDLEGAYFQPFVRFGKHGDAAARSQNPFKNPVIMADEGAVFPLKPTGKPGRSYLGRPAHGVSKAQPKAVSQGYTPLLPLHMENTK
ncbi:MAG: hypothetical protein JEZ12_28150 [Desulfobacterium sp.]|nr:hypothetical protein [Desulfobacterium sp.]